MAFETVSSTKMSCLFGGDTYFYRDGFHALDINGGMSADRSFWRTLPNLDITDPATLELLIGILGDKLFKRAPVFVPPFATEALTDEQTTFLAKLKSAAPQVHWGEA